MSVKWEDVKPGDKIKVRQNGMMSEDWMTVKAVGGNAYGPYARVDHWAFYSDESEITAHQPAPRKVEVTLGKPFARGGEVRSYVGDGSLMAGLNGLSEDGPHRGEIYIKVPTPTSSLALPEHEARRLALDILATTGLED